MMAGIVNWFDRKKGYGFIWGTGSVMQDGKENVLPEYFVHTSQINGRKPKRYEMVIFDPSSNEKGLLALDVSVIPYTGSRDPNYYIANRIFDEFDIEIPYLLWAMTPHVCMRDIFRYLRADRDNDLVEMKQISEEYGLEKVAREEHISCIAACGYELWKYDKQKMKEEGDWEE